RERRSHRQCSTTPACSQAPLPKLPYRLAPSACAQAACYAQTSRLLGSKIRSATAPSRPRALELRSPPSAVDLCRTAIGLAGYVSAPCWADTDVAVRLAVRKSHPTAGCVLPRLSLGAACSNPTDAPTGRRRSGLGGWGPQCPTLPRS